MGFSGITGVGNPSGYCNQDNDNEQISHRVM